MRPLPLSQGVMSNHSASEIPPSRRIVGVSKVHRSDLGGLPKAKATEMKSSDERLGVWRPGILLARRARLPLKLGIFLTLLLVPLIVLVALTVQRTNKEILQTEAEIEGLAIISSASQVFTLLNVHQGLSTKVTPGNVSIQNSLDKTRSELRQASAHTQSVVDDSRSFDQRAQWKAIDARLKLIVLENPIKMKDGIKRHVELMSDLRAWLYSVGEVSNFLRDRDLASHSLMEMVFNRPMNWAVKNDQNQRANLVKQLSDSPAQLASDSSILAQDLASQIRAYGLFTNSLQTRVNTLVFERNSLISGVVLGFIVLFYLLITFYKSFSADLASLGQTMTQLTAGNLRVVHKVRSKDEIGDLDEILRRMIVNISSMVASVGSDATLVVYAGRELDAGNRHFSDGIEQQAAKLKQTQTIVQGLAFMVEKNAQTASDLNQTTKCVCSIAEAGAQSMQASIESIMTIQTGAARMNEVIGVIDGLAFQTNILALNAAVEAARAGDQGRGFAVVASEVRALAQRCAASAREVRGLIETSSSQVDASVAQIRTAGEGMSRIVTGIQEVSNGISEISKASIDQSSGTSEVSSAVVELGALTQRNVELIERAVTQSNSLDKQASSLLDASLHFKLLQGVATEAVAMVERAMNFHAQASSSDDFLRGLTVKENNFYDRDMYIFVLDRKGTYLAFGGNQAKVGTRVQDLAGIDGEGLIKSIVSQASDGPGWVEYNITNPTSGKVQAKMSFVQRVDDVYVGCGIYKSLSVA